MTIKPMRAVNRTSSSAKRQREMAMLCLLDNIWDLHSDFVASPINATDLHAAMRRNSQLSDSATYRMAVIASMQTVIDAIGLFAAQSIPSYTEIDETT